MGTLNTSKLASEDAVRRFIVEAIDTGSMPAGTRLPTERILAERFRVPRSVVRKALLPLEIAGTVTRHVGRGTFVSGGREEQQSVATRSVDTSPAEVMEACLICYPYMSELAVTKATATDLRAIEHCVQHLRKTKTIAEYAERDDAFHQAIANATHNELLIEIARTIGRARERTDWGELQLHERTSQEHAGILEALTKRNAKLAHDRTKAHLLSARHSLLGGTG
jgi:DNA-binding FadR family transcriptional regulator